VVTLAALIPRAGDWLGYRYDFGDCWDHDIEVEKIHRAATKTTYPRCSGGGRACPPEDSGGPEGYEDHMRALRHRKGWKYQVAKSVFGTTKWDPAKWDRAEVNIGLAGLAKLWAKQAAAKAKQQAKEMPATIATTVVTSAATEASPAPSAPVDGRPGNGVAGVQPLDGGAQLGPLFAGAGGLFDDLAAVRAFEGLAWRLHLDGRKRDR
jgi:hypothetical protein